MSRSSMCFNTISLHDLAEILIPLTLNFALNTSQYNHACTEKKNISYVYFSWLFKYFIGSGELLSPLSVRRPWSEIVLKHIEDLDI
jgi:hypothetical protein